VKGSKTPIREKINFFLMKMLYIFVKSNFYTMKISIILTDKKTSTRIDLAELKKKAKAVFNKDVRPQIARAKSKQKPSNTIKCNNPI
jgi:hypothetical protein